MMAYYADESYDSTTFCVGGWLHDAERWKEVETKWNQRIEYERRQSIKKGQQPISRFHASDCSTRHGEYEGWTVPRQKLFFKKLVEIICEHEPHGIAWGSSFKDLRQSFPHYKQKTAQRLLYFLCMQQCLKELVEIMREHYTGKRVTVIHDFGFNGVAQRAFELIKKRYDPSGTIVTVAPMESKDCVFLQPADFMAYEGSKICFRHRNDNPEIRKSFQKILNAKLPLSVGYLKENIFSDMAKKGVK
jgi:Protein of unknown function (DUF3800)